MRCRRVPGADAPAGAGAAAAWAPGSGTGEHSECSTGQGAGRGRREASGDGGGDGGDSCQQRECADAPEPRACRRSERFAAVSVKDVLGEGPSAKAAAMGVDAVVPGDSGPGTATVWCEGTVPSL